MKKTVLFALSVAVVLPLLTHASEIGGGISTGVSTGISGILAATPVASPAPGTYDSAQSVTLTATGSDAIHYTVDAAAPTCTTGTVYSGAISVSSSHTIRAVACYGGTASAVGTFAYGINITAPTPNPTPTPTPTPTPSSSSGGGGGGGGSAPTNKPGDFNHDNKVDILDFNTLVVEWGATGSALTADLNHDGVVDLLDFNQLLVNWTG